MNKMKKKSVPAVCLLMVAWCLFLSPGCIKDQVGRSAPADDAEFQQPSKPLGAFAGDASPDDTVMTAGPDDTTARLVFTGNLIFEGRVIAATLRYGNGDYSFPFALLGERLRSADLAIANIESPDLEILQGLLFAGIDIAVLANERFFDRGLFAAGRFLGRLAAAGIWNSGGGSSHDDAYRPRVITIKGNEIAFVSLSFQGSRNLEATGDHPGVAWCTDENLERSIEAARAKAKIVVVSLHGGGDYDEWPDERQDRFAHLACDRGARLVIGHHSHRMQPVVVYNGSYIAYALGDCVSDTKRNSGSIGYLLEVFISENRITGVQQVRLRRNELYQTGLD